MLILTRRIGEEVILGEGATQARITVLSIRGNQVRVGITADKKIPVNRKEIHDRIQAERQAHTEEAVPDET